MTINRALFSSDKQNWCTPDDLYATLNEEFHFTIDAAASKDNAKCAQYFTEEDSALSETACWDTGSLQHSVWVNPPYRQEEKPCKKNCTKKRCVKRGFHCEKYTPGIIDWLKKGSEQARKYGMHVVMLLPSRTGAKWFQKFVIPILKGVEAGEVRFLPGRIKFKGAPSGAPFDSVLVIF